MQPDRRPRRDFPGAWHHVMNRGVARRPIFETEQDVRVFLCLLAKRVRAGELEIHSYSVLTTHFHLLVRSTAGELSRAMMQAESLFARWFNAMRKRDGPLFRSRFCSRRIDNGGYLDNVIRYIDHNAVDAGIARAAAEYPYGSAYHYLGDTRTPWLTTADLRQRACRAQGVSECTPDVYARTFGAPPTAGAAWVIQRNIGSGLAAHRPDRYPDGPLALASSAARCALLDQARNADGSAAAPAIASPDSVDAYVAERRALVGTWRHALLRSHHDLWTVMSLALRAELSGLSSREIARTAGHGRDTVARHLQLHRLLVAIDAPYRERWMEACGALASEVYGASDI